MKGGKANGKGEEKGRGGGKEEKGKYLYAEPKFMIPPDPLKLPEPFRGGGRREEGQGRKE